MRQHRIITAATLTLAAICLSSCYVRVSDEAKKAIREKFPKVVYGKMDSVVFHPGEFTSLACSGGVDVVLIPTQTEEPWVVVSGSTNLRDSVIVENSGGILNISMRTNISRDETAWVHAPAVSLVNTYGSGDFSARGVLQTDTLSIRSHGSGDTFLGDVNVEGPLTLVKLGSGDTRGKVTAGRITIRTLGSGDVDLEVSRADTLQISASGSGDVNLKGDVKEVIFSKKGSGDICAEPLKAGKVTLDEISGSGEVTYTQDGKKVRAGKK